MLPVGWLIAAVLLAILLSMWVTFTLTRLDRLHARVDAARAALDAQLVRRAAALLHVAEAPESGLGSTERARYADLAQDALTSTGVGREAIENAVGRAVAHLAGGSVAVGKDAVAELREAAVRVQVSRRFYNDAVRDTRTLRSRRMPRLLRLAGNADLPQFFDIDDTQPPAEPASVRPDDIPDLSDQNS
ncbi:MAG TPA: hypothetical protein VFE19_02075 [Jatrophihabitantaceae bacterium]|nr:hypothetical protein [Jatrophihabitantaceae bacterium]